MLLRIGLFFLLGSSTFIVYPSVAVAGEEELVKPRKDLAEEGLVYLPTVEDGSVVPAKTPEQVSSVLVTMAMLTILTLAPSILIMTTCFTRIVIVMSFLRRALATQTMPPDQVLIGLSLFLTLFIMYPTWMSSWQSGIEPYLSGKRDPETGRRMTQGEAIERVLAPHRAFMFACLEANQGKEEVDFFMGMYGKPPEEANSYFAKEEIPTHVLIPAFITAELKRAFWMGFLLYLPFLILDIVIASVLMAMGMMMLPPVMISLPFKIILFVLVDGWRLLMEGIVSSFPPSVVQQLATVGG